MVSRELQGPLIIIHRNHELSFTWWISEGKALTAVGAQYTDFVQSLHKDGLLSGGERIECHKDWDIE